MNITRENIDDLNAVLTLNIGKADYEEKVENVLKDYRKKANIKGFRPYGAYRPDKENVWRCCEDR
jgi:trigger factor